MSNLDLLTIIKWYRQIIYKKKTRVKTMIVKKYLLYLGRHLPVWITLTLLSITILYILVSYTAPREERIKVVVSQGARQVINVSRNLTSIKRNASASHNPVDKLFKTLYASLIIYLNNLKVNMLFAIPLAGAIFYGYALTYNAWVMRYLGTTLMGSEGYVRFLAILLSQPHTYLEILAYSIVVTESSYLSYYLFITRNITREKITYYLLSLLLSNTILFIAAVVETIIL